MSLLDAVSNEEFQSRNRCVTASQISAFSLSCETVRGVGRATRELPLMTSAKYSDFLTHPPLSTFGTELKYKIHSTSLTTSAFPWPPTPSNADIISGSPSIELWFCNHINIGSRREKVNVKIILISVLTTSVPELVCCAQANETAESIAQRIAPNLLLLNFILSAQSPSL